MVELPELTIEQWVFVGQAFLLGVGAIVTIKLVPYFTNKYQNKQIEIDREREDRRQQLNIQHNLINKLTNVNARSWVMFDFRGAADPKKKNLLTSLEIERMIMDVTELHYLLIFYYGETSEIMKEFNKISTVVVGSIEYLSVHLNMVDDDPTKQDQIKGILKVYDLTLDVNDVINKIKKNGIGEILDIVNFTINDLIVLIEKTPPRIN